MQNTPSTPEVLWGRLVSGSLASAERGVLTLEAPGDVVHMETLHYELQTIIRLDL